LESGFSSETTFKLIHLLPVSKPKTPFLPTAGVSTESGI
jgi:hypothetical protein